MPDPAPGVYRPDQGEPLPVRCPTCGRRPGYRTDGAYRHHRIDAHNPVAAYCPASTPGERN